MTTKMIGETGAMRIAAQNRRSYRNMPHRTPPHKLHNWGPLCRHKPTIGTRAMESADMGEKGTWRNSQLNSLLYANR